MERRSTISSRARRVVPLENAYYLIDRVSSTDTTLVTLSDSAHLPTLDDDQERVQVACASFIERVLSRTNPRPVEDARNPRWDLVGDGG